MVMRVAFLIPESICGTMKTGGGGNNDRMKFINEGGG